MIVMDSVLHMRLLQTDEKSEPLASFPAGLVSNQSYPFTLTITVTNSQLDWLS